MTIAHYYLHTNGDLIHKKFEIEPSDFTKKIWTLDLTNRSDAWFFLLEATFMGARIDRLKELAKLWKCDKDDLKNFITRYPHPKAWQIDAMDKYLKEVLELNPDEVWEELENAAL